MARNVTDTLPQGMKDPVAPGEQAMGGAHKGDTHLNNTDMGSAVKLLNEQNERGAHSAVVAGVKMTGNR